MHKLTDRERYDRALENAEQLAHDLRVLGYEPQAQIIEDLITGLYSAKLQRAVADLARR